MYSNHRLTPGDRFIRLHEVMAMTGRKKTLIYTDPTFPKRIRLGARETVWVESEIRLWMQNRVDEYRGAAA